MKKLQVSILYEKGWCMNQQECNNNETRLSPAVKLQDGKMRSDSTIISSLISRHYHNSDRVDSVLHTNPCSPYSKYSTSTNSLINFTILIFVYHKDLFAIDAQCLWNCIIQGSTLSFIDFERDDSFFHLKCIYL